MQTSSHAYPGLWRLLVRDGRPLIYLTGLVLIGSGLFVGFQAATGHFLPHDEAFLGVSAQALCDLHGCRIVHFMIHDRISFGGVLIAIGTLYLYLVAGPLVTGEAWAWWAVLVSGVAGFASFLSYLGYGYLDTWHGAGTLVLLPIFITGLVITRRSLGIYAGPRCLLRPGWNPAWRSPAGVGRGLLLLTGGGLMLAGLVIMVVGMTSVFVPEDLGYMGLTAAELREINPRLIPLIAHDRAGFGGGGFCLGLTMLLCGWCGRPSRALWEALLVAGVVSFGAAIGVHFPIGYTTLSHLVPAYLGALIFLAGMALTWRPMCQAPSQGAPDKRPAGGRAAWR